MLCSCPCNAEESDQKWSAFSSFLAPRGRVLQCDLIELSITSWSMLLADTVDITLVERWLIVLADTVDIMLI